MGAHSLKPTRKGRIRMTGEADKDGDVNAFRQKPEHKFHLFRVGFQIIEQGIDAAHEDLGTGLAFEALDPIMRTIINEGMQVVVGDTTIRRNPKKL